MPIMSFDDLQFSGLTRAHNTIPVHCPICHKIVDIHKEDKTCPIGHPLPTQVPNPLLASSLHSNLNRQTSDDDDSSSSSSPFINFPALSSLNLEQLFGSLNTGTANPNAHNNFLEMLRAQQGLNIDDLIQSLLTQPEYNGTPTSPAYLATLQPSPLTEADFIQVLIKVAGVDRDILPTLAQFGSNIIQKHKRKAPADEEKKDNEAETKTSTPTTQTTPSGTIAGQSQLQISLPLIAVTPFDGHQIINGAALKGRVALLNRGKISFVDKCRNVQRCGAVAAIICQLNEEWPYIMTDTAKTGGDIIIPCFLVSQRDAGLIQSALRRAAAIVTSTSSSSSVSTDDHKENTISGQQQPSSPPVNISIFTRDRELACPVCREDFSIGDSALKLPCNHHFHPPCILDWLKQRNLCALCRYVLPTEGKKVGEEQRLREEQKQLHEAMFT